MGENQELKRKNHKNSKYEKEKKSLNLQWREKLEHLNAIEALILAVASLFVVWLTHISERN